MSKYGVFSGPYFPVFGLNTEIYSVNLRIQSAYRKLRTRKNSVFGHLHSARLWLYSNRACAIFILGTIAEKSFRNLQNKYGREKRKWKVTNRSGAGAGEVKRPYIIDSLGWLEPYFIDRETASNWETNRDETLVQQDDGEVQEFYLFYFIIFFIYS